jgi:uncharacterized protein YjbI with pentapeptide repeats
LIEQLKEALRSADELVDYDTSGNKCFYVLKEDEAGRLDRIRCNGLAKLIPVNEIRKNKSNILSKEVFYLDVMGDYFPDFLEESGVHLVSNRFLEYLQSKIDLQNVYYSSVILVAESGKRIEEYFLLLPEEVDGVLKENARYDKLGNLRFFEIDSAITGALQLFKVTGFPYLITTAKLNRLEYTGFQCIRIENFCHYETERDQLLIKRINSEKLQEAVEEYEKKADATGDINYKFSLRRVFSNHFTLNNLQKELKVGLKGILDSYRGNLPELEQLSDRFLLFVWSWKLGSVILAEEYAEYFGKTEIILNTLVEAKKYIPKLPQDLTGPAIKVCLETVTHLLSIESKIFKEYHNIHNNRRFRLYLYDETSRSMNPYLIYDYRNPYQQKIESAQSIYGFDLSHQDLSEFELKNKSFVGMKFEGCNMRRAMFNNSNLAGVELINCDLTGADFQKCNLRGAKFINCMVDRVNFEETIMNEAEFNNCYLRHNGFIKADLTGVWFANQDLTYNYFVKTELTGAVFEIVDCYEENVFRLCNLEAAKFTGISGHGETSLRYCDFSNSKLNNSEFILDVIAYSNFSKTQLNNGDFSQSDLITGCNFKNCVCFLMNIAGLTIEECDFSYVNLSGLKIRNGTWFRDCDFTYTNLSGYDFTIHRYGSSNILAYTNLANCKMDGADFCDSKLIEANFNGAKLSNARFTEEQLKLIQLSSMQRNEIQVVTQDTVPSQAPAVILISDNTSG